MSLLDDPVWAMVAAQFETAQREWATPGELASHLDPRTRQTGALDLIDAALVDLLDTPDGRLIISMPPQEGKSTRVAKDLPTWWLKMLPDTRIVCASYAQGLANRNGRVIRRNLTEHPELGLTIAPDNGSVHEWQLAGHDGGVLSVGVGAGLTGRPADLLLIDDPIKDRREADSETFRENVWSWWTDVASTRLAPGAPVVLILCMTGDTPVLMADGTERSLREIRPGDEVATYERGGLTTSTVRNWASQGYDSVYRIRMNSGVEVRANARHPFLTVDKSGVETWLRTDQLKPGSLILRATGESGVELSAPSRAAQSPRNVEACACGTTVSSVGPRVTGPRRSTLSHGEPPSSVTVTRSRLRSTTDSSPPRKASARSAGATPTTPALRPTGETFSVSITTMRLGPCAACSATTATSLSDGSGRLQPSEPPLITWSVTPDLVVEVVPAGVEEVFNLQVDRTENFIAAGLVSHNTRWHEDDLAGRLLAAEDGHTWRVLNIPAQADHDPNKGDTDLLDRQPGQFMESARGRTDAQWEAIKVRSGSRTWASLYQGRPSPAAGNIFMRDWWREYTQPLWIERGDGSRFVPGDDIELLISWDLAFKDTKTSDYVCGQVWMRRGADCYLLDQTWGRYDFVATCREIRTLAARWPQALLKLVEDKANGPAVIAALNRTVPGIVPEEPHGSKEARASAVSPLVEAGNVWLPAPELAPWVGDLIEEAAAFPNAANDDRVDSLTMALNRLVLLPLLAETWQPEIYDMVDARGFYASPV